MSDKSIELQIALPRTYDASKLQDQAARRPVIDQEQLAQSQLQIDDKNRRKSTEATETDAAKLKDKQGQGREPGRDQQNQSSQKQNEKNERQMSSHPYKGKRIDISL